MCTGPVSRESAEVGPVPSPGSATTGNRQCHHAADPAGVRAMQGRLQVLHDRLAADLRVRAVDAKAWDFLIGLCTHLTIAAQAREDARAWKVSMRARLVALDKEERQSYAAMQRCVSRNPALRADFDSVGHPACRRPGRTEETALRDFLLLQTVSNYEWRVAAATKWAFAVAAVYPLFGLGHPDFGAGPVHRDSAAYDWLRTLRRDVKRREAKSRARGHYLSAELKRYVELRARVLPKLGM